VAQEDAVFGEVDRRLVHLGLPEDVRAAVMAIVRDGAGSAPLPEPSPEPSDAHLPVLVARTFYKTALRATDTLGSSSLSMLVMLFDLFVAHEQERHISVTSLCIASGAAPTTALRQIGQLEERGFVTRRGDEHDGRRSWVHPTPRAMDLIRSLVEEWVAVLRS
jgi:DNA-binding MarR family transcriptional regulator